MAKEKIKKIEELKEEQLDNISGGGSTSRASFSNSTGGIDPFTGEGIGGTRDEIMY